MPFFFLLHIFMGKGALVKWMNNEKCWRIERTHKHCEIIGVSFLLFHFRKRIFSPYIQLTTTQGLCDVLSFLWTDFPFCFKLILVAGYSPFNCKETVTAQLIHSHSHSSYVIGPCVYLSMSWICRSNKNNVETNEVKRNLINRLSESWCQ